MYSRRRAQEMFSPTPPPTPTTYERFLKRAHADANEDAFEDLLKTATREDLIEIVREMRKERQPNMNGNTVRALWRDHG